MVGHHIIVITLFLLSCMDRFLLDRVCLDSDSGINWCLSNITCIKLWVLYLVKIKNTFSVKDFFV